MVEVFGLCPSTTGSISGIVVDPQKAVVAGAVVTVKNLETNAAQTVAADSEGRFRFQSLPVGTYGMTVEQKGFARYVMSSITITLNQAAVIDVAMELSGTKEEVTVTADVGLINRSNAETGVRFDSRRVSELPLAPNRNILNLVLSVRA